MSAVDVKLTNEHELTLEWDSSASNDIIADSTLALITGIDKSPASVKRTSFTPFMSHTALIGKQSLPYPTRILTATRTQTRKARHPR